MMDSLEGSGLHGRPGQALARRRGGPGARASERVGVGYRHESQAPGPGRQGPGPVIRIVLRLTDDDRDCATAMIVRSG